MIKGIPTRIGIINLSHKKTCRAPGQKTHPWQPSSCPSPGPHPAWRSVSIGPPSGWGTAEGSWPSSPYTADVYASAEIGGPWRNSRPALFFRPPTSLLLLRAPPHCLNVKCTAATIWRLTIKTLRIVASSQPRKQRCTSQTPTNLCSICCEEGVGNKLYKKQLKWQFTMTWERTNISPCTNPGFEKLFFC